LINLLAVADLCHAASVPHVSCAVFGDIL